MPPPVIGGVQRYGVEASDPKSSVLENVVVVNGVGSCASGGAPDANAIVIVVEVVIPDDIANRVVEVDSLGKVKTGSGEPIIVVIDLIARDGVSISIPQLDPVGRGIWTIR
jgi:hypothetical protein